MIKERSYTSVKLVRAREVYNGDPRHPNHLDKKVTAKLLHLMQPQQSLTDVAWQHWHRYLAGRGVCRGRVPKQIASELIYRSPAEAFLSEYERCRIFRHLCAQLAPDSPATGFWHIHKDGSADLHILVCNVTMGVGPVLRREAYGHGKTNYYRVMHEAENSAIASINQNRRQSGGQVIKTMPVTRAIIALAKGIIPLAHQLFLLRPKITEENLVESVQKLGHQAEVRPRCAEMVWVRFGSAQHFHRYGIVRLLQEAKAPPQLELIFDGMGPLAAMSDQERRAYHNAIKIDADVERVALQRLQQQEKPNGQIR